MERQKPTTSVKHNDEFSKALMDSYTRWMGGETFQGTNIYEETYPELQKKGGEDDFRKKDPKANAGAPDPAVDLRTGSGVKQSHGAEIKDTTKVVAREERELCESCGKAKCACGDKKDMKKETVEFELDGVTYVFEAEKKKGLDGKACWKGYKQMGTKQKGGKTVDNCVKAGYEPEGEMLGEKKLDPAGKEDKDVDNDGDHDKSDKYLLARRKKVSAIIGKKKKMKEEVELRQEIEEEKK